MEVGLVMAEACPNAEKHWFALTVKPLHEKSVAQQLNAKGIEGYVPVYKAPRRWSDRVKMIDRPLFPWYVFCRFSFDERLKVLATLSVLSVVGFAGKPCPLSDDEINSVQLAAASGLPVGPWPSTCAGQRIVILKGPLAGVRGILSRQKGTDRVIVNIEMINRALAVEIDRDLVSLAVTTPA